MLISLKHILHFLVSSILLYVYSVLQQYRLVKSYPHEGGMWIFAPKSKQIKLLRKEQDKHRAL